MIIRGLTLAARTAAIGGLTLAARIGAARTMFHLPYYSADMQTDERDGWFHYRSRRTGAASGAADLICRYRPTAPVQLAERGSLGQFLTERYCLYTFDDAMHLYRLEIHHPQWPLQPAEAEFQVNTMAEASDIPLPAMSPLLHFSKRQDMVAWPMRALDEDQ